MKEIQLTQGQVVLVDDEDFELLNQWKWFAIKGQNTFYAARHVKNKNKQTTIFLHRFIMNTTDPKIEIDHKDRNGLNCQKYNLRECDHAQNNQNKGLGKNNKTGYKGVSLCKDTFRRKKYTARIRVGNKYLSLGHFLTPENAAYAYDVAAIKYFGDFAFLNFPGTIS